jgi:hypothetical protein
LRLQLSQHTNGDPSALEATEDPIEQRAAIWQMVEEEQPTAEFMEQDQPG